MGKTYIKLDNQEKLILDKIHVITEIPKAVIKKVFLGLLFAHSIEFYDENELVVPYICKLDVDVFSNTVSNNIVEGGIKLNATPSNSLEDEIIAITNGETTKSEQYNKENIRKRVQEILEIDPLSVKSFLEKLL